MSKVRVRVSKSLKGVMTIAPLKHDLQANNVIFVSDEDFLSNNVQLAVQRGILLIEHLPSDVKEAVETNLVKLVNKTKKNLSLEKSGLSFKQGGSLIVHRNVMKQRDVIEALGSGALDTLGLDELVVAKPEKQKPKKALVKDSNKNQKTLSEIKKPEEPAVNVDEFDLEEHFLEVQKEVLEKQKAEMEKTKTKMSSWNPDGELLGKDDSTKAVMEQQNAQTMEINHGDEVDFGDAGFVDMTEEEPEFVDPDADAKKRAKKTKKKKASKKKKKTTKKKKAKKKKTKAKKKELSDAFVDKDHDDIDFIDDPDGLDEISFVNEEQDQERISAKKDRIADMNEEIS
tara:strand:- start:259 stop:1284 length:1026 start_codon:yes stop_codon:yes gene_type:complete